jgi:phage repressor protein C with HTH and peptisase S24 domain
MQEKEQKKSPIKQRILQFAQFLGVTKREFYASTAISRGTLESKTGITEDVLTKVFATYPQLNIIWVMTGEGKMVKKLTGPTAISDEQTEKNQEKTVEAIPAFFGDASLKPIPLVSATAAAGFGSESFCIHADDVKEYYSIPKFRLCKIDFMIEVTGHSMFPKFSAGDVVACTILNNKSFLQWNKCHVIATREQGILVKRLMPGADEHHLKAVSDNVEYPPFEIPVEEITGIALVVGSVCLE